MASRTPVEFQGMAQGRGFYPNCAAWILFSRKGRTEIAARIPGIMMHLFTVFAPLAMGEAMAHYLHETLPAVLGIVLGLIGGTLLWSMYAYHVRKGPWLVYEHSTKTLAIPRSGRRFPAEQVVCIILTFDRRSEEFEGARMGILSRAADGTYEHTPVIGCEDSRQMERAAQRLGELIDVPVESFCE